MKKLTIKKDLVREILDKYPDNIIVEDFIEELIITAKVEIARQQIICGNFLTSAQLYKEIKKWN